MKTKGKSGVMDMTQGNMAMLILSFALPLMLGNVFQQFYTVADTAIVGKILGVDALAALGTVESINWLVLGTIQGITQGFGILVSQQFGAKKRGGASGNHFSCVLSGSSGGDFIYRWYSDRITWFGRDFTGSC
ncbi:MAG: MATE family efflux transporter [Gallintestinimicrobium sp.]